MVALDPRPRRLQSILGFQVGPVVGDIHQGGSVAGIQVREMTNEPQRTSSSFSIGSGETKYLSHGPGADTSHDFVCTFAPASGVWLVTFEITAECTTSPGPQTGTGMGIVFSGGIDETPMGPLPFSASGDVSSGPVTLFTPGTSPLTASVSLDIAGGTSIIEFTGTFRATRLG